MQGTKANSFNIKLPLLAQRCNGTTAEIGDSEVGLECPYKCPLQAMSL